MGKHHQRAKRYKHDDTGAVPDSVKQARQKIIEGRRTLNVQTSFEGFQLLAAQEDIPLPVDLVTTVLSVFVESPNTETTSTMTAEERSKLQAQANEIYTRTLAAHGGETKHKISEAFYSTSMRVLLRLDDLESALRVKQDMMDAGHEVRHRAYSPLLAKACAMENNGGYDMAKSFYEVMSKENKVDDEDAVVMLQALAKRGGEKEFVDRVLLDCERRALDVPNERLAKAVLGDKDETCYAPLAEGNQCASCKQVMRSVDAEQDVVRALIKDTAALAPVLNPDKKREWDQFLEWEAKHLGEFDCIVDGANMAFFRSGAPNTEHNEPKYEHADVMMDHLVNKLGRKPLLFFHARHFKHHGGIPKPIVAKWKTRTYVVPHGHNDDVFWLHFALQLSLNNPQAWLVTNDLMRDHKFEMINTSTAFARWRERHQVAYDVIFDFKQQCILTGVYPPLPYSVQIQHATVAAEGGLKWHVPKQVAPTEEELALERQCEALRKLSPQDLRREMQQRKISFDLFRQIRCQASGCERPKTEGKKYVWACI